MSRQEDRIIELLQEIRDAVVDDSESEAVAEPYHCGYDGCSRIVDNPDARCWQHD